MIYYLCRYAHRFVPVSGNCVANLAEIETLCRNVFRNFFAIHGDTRFTVSRQVEFQNFLERLNDRRAISTRWN